MLAGKGKTFIDEQPLWVASTKLDRQDGSLTVPNLLELFLKRMTIALHIKRRRRTIHAPPQLGCKG